MKHNRQQTIALLCWTAFSLLLGLLFTGFVEPIPFLSGKEGGSQIPFIIIIVGVIVLGSLMWIAILKFKRKYVDKSFAFGMSFLFMQILGFTLEAGFPNHVLESRIVALCMIPLFYVAFT